MSVYRSLTIDRLCSQHRTQSTVGPDNTSAAAVSRSRSRTSYHFRGSSRWTCLPRNLTRTGRSPCPCPEVGGALSLLPHLLLPGKTLLPLPAAHSSTRMQGEYLPDSSWRPFFAKTRILAHKSSSHPRAGAAKVVLCHVFIGLS